MSTSWYKPGFVPKLIRKWTTESNISSIQNRARSIEVWEATCIVTNFSKAIVSQSRDDTNNSDGKYCSYLINPANPSLSGVSKFPYFPKGGPEPESQPKKDSHPIMGYVTQWGGMEVGNGMLFAANVVDGLVHQLGSKELQIECEKAIRANSGSLLEEGAACVTNSGNEKLTDQYSYICHTIPPFYSDGDSVNNHIDNTNISSRSQEGILESCYRNSFGRILQHHHQQQLQPTILRIACPLLGAGCRNFPEAVAIDVAAKSATKSMFEGENQEKENNESSTQTKMTTTNSSPSSIIPQQTSSSIVVAFVIPSSEIRKKLIDAIDRHI